MSDCSINNVEFNIVYSKEEKNILKVNSKKEIFFEVFECSVFDDDSIVVEQTGLWNDLPLVYVEFIKENKKYSCEAVLVEDGTTEFVVNEDNLFYLDQIKKEEDNIQETENKVNEDIKLEINHTYDEKIKEYEDKKFNFLNELELQFEDKITNLKEDISIKLDTFFDKLEDKKKELIDDEIESITLNLNEKYDSFKKEVNELSDFNRDNIDSILENKITDIDNTVKLFLDNLTENYSSKFKNNDKKVTASLIEINSIRNKLKKYHENSEEKFNDLFKLEEKLVNQDDYSDKNKEIFEFINEELDRINNKFIYISEEENKKYNELLAAVSKTDVVEYKTILKEKIQDVELNLVKEELKSELSSNFKNEITSLKRYAEMSAGGGNNAVQYANGGTMNGSLNVNGTILSGGRNLDEIFATDGGGSLGEYLPLSGGNLTGQLSSNNTIIAETILATNILSATNLDIGYELSGFNVTGSISASGNLSANNIYGNEIYDNGNRVCTSFPSQTLQSVTDNGKITTNDIQVANLSATGNIIANPISNKASSSSGILAGCGNCATGNYSIVVGGRDNIASGNCSVVVGGFGNAICGTSNSCSSILGGASNKICHSKSFIIGSNMTTNADCTTFVNNLSSQYNLYSNNLTASCNVNIVGKTTVGKITLSDTSFVSESADFTLGEEHRGATVLLQNPSPMTVTVPSQVAGHTTTFIAETINDVSFATGVGISGLNSFNGANSMLGQFAQAQIIFKTSEYAFLGGQIT